MSSGFRKEKAGGHYWSEAGFILEWKAKILAWLFGAKGNHDEDEAEPDRGGRLHPRITSCRRPLSEAKT